MTQNRRTAQHSRSPVSDTAPLSLMGDLSPALRPVAGAGCCRPLAREQAPISAGTLVHELWLDLQSRDGLQFESRAASFGLCRQGHALAARGHGAGAPGAQAACRAQSLTLGMNWPMPPPPRADAGPEPGLERLGRPGCRLLQVAELRAVIGLEVDEVARVLGAPSRR